MTGAAFASMVIFRIAASCCILLMFSQALGKVPDISAIASKVGMAE